MGTSLDLIDGKTLETRWSWSQDTPTSKSAKAQKGRITNKRILICGQWRALPHRDALAGLAVAATPLPKDIRRQFPIETIVGEEAAAAISGNKSIDAALADMERRVNAVLQNL